MINVEEKREYCISKPQVSEGFPFGGEVLVFKVYSKMFALIDLQNPDTINLKCEPENAIALREKYDEVQPGYHMNNKHWNTISLMGTLSQNQITQFINDSYDLVLKSVPRKELI